MREWFTRAWLPAHPGCSIAYQALTANPPHEVLGVPRQEYLDSLDAFRLSHARALSPCTRVLGWLQEHGAEFRHLAITATPLHTSPISAAWVMEHFGRWIRTVSVIPSPRSFDTAPKYDATKLDYLRWLGRVDLLVDDSEANLAGAEDAGIKAIVFPRPWNHSRITIDETLAQLL